MPGVAVGNVEYVAIRPAFPYDVIEPGRSGSNTVTAWPSRCRYIAVETPAIPAPITAAVFAVPGSESDMPSSTKWLQVR